MGVSINEYRNRVFGIMEFKELDNQLDQWERFVETNKLGNFGQSSYQFELLLSRGRKAKLFGVVNDKDEILLGGSLIGTLRN